MSAPKWKFVALAMGPLGGLAAFAATMHLESQPGAADLAVAWTALVTVWCAVWWMTEVVPIPVTSLIPIALLPAVGVLDAKRVGQAYGSSLVLLMMGGFMLSTAMQRSGVHRRLAILMIRAVGGESSRRLIIGFMAASAVLSMWISNAATVLMLLPIALAAVEDVRDRRVHTRLLLGLAYAASLGGTATPIGTPPNLIFMDIYKSQFGAEPSFLDWMGIALPVTLAMLPIACLYLTRGIRLENSYQFPNLGPWRPEEKRTLIVFACTCVLWMSRKAWSQLTWGGISLANANDASVAFLAVIVMFLIPRGNQEGSAHNKAQDPSPQQDSPAAEANSAAFYDALLDWKTASNIQWGVLLLFSGGLVIAAAFQESGLSSVLGKQLSEIASLPPLLMIGAICLCVTFLTEITSNTATTTLLLPILAAAATAAEVDPLLLMGPATLSASFAFMLPVATPTNAIAFGGSDIRAQDMAREGFALNLIGVVVVTARFLLYT